MIYEFAVDPELFRSWEDVRYITEHFGVSEGRLISRFPKKWESMVYQALEGLDDNAHMRVVEKLATIKDKMQTRVHEWDRNMRWLENAEREYSQRPFHAILTSAPPDVRDYILDYREIDDRNPFWNVDRERVVSRSATALASAVAPLLRIARTIAFVDPYFDPYKPRVCAALRAYLEAAITRRMPGAILEKVEFHTAYRPEIRDYRAECLRRLPSLIPEQLALQVHRLSPIPGGDEMHNRYILTDRGGIRLAWGLDEGNTFQTDDVSLLCASVFNQRWEQYCGHNPGFKCEETIDIAGARRLR